MPGTRRSSTYRRPASFAVAGAGSGTFLCASARAFAFAAGTHRDAYKVDRAEHRHATEFFVRFRPLYSEGTFEGRDPLAGVLDRNATGRDLAPPDSGAGEWRAARATSRTGESSHEDATR